jgi:dihydrofolate reductase
MARLIYSAITSLDGYVEDAQGHFEWGAPDEEVFSFISDLERPVGTYLYGRRMYETMLYWETAPLDESAPLFLRDWAEIWRGAEKVVYSRTLRAASTARTRVEPSFDPGAVRRLKETAGHDLTVGGPDLAGQALRADLVDELQLFLVPIVVGGGKPWLPDNVQPDNVQINLELLGSHCFASGVVFLRYRPAGASGAAATER